MTKSDVLKVAGWGATSTMHVGADDTDSIVSFGQPMTAKPIVKLAWSANDKVNHEQYHRMVDEYRDAKRREKELDIKARQLAAQLARTEEAAKRSLIQSDVTAKGGTAQKLLDAECAIAKLRGENAALSSQLVRQKKVASDYKAGAEEARKRLDDSLKQQRITNRKNAEFEKLIAKLRRKPEDEFWGEEAGRRFAEQQEDLVNMREQNEKLKKALKTEGPAAHIEALESQVAELNQLVAFYEKKMRGLAEQHLLPPDDSIPYGPGPDDWLLEEHPVGDEMYLLDRKTSKVFTIPGEGNWPRPVGVRANGEVSLGSKNKMEHFLNELDKHKSGHRQGLKALFDKFDVDGSGNLDRRELSSMLAQLMPDLNPRDVDEVRMVLDVDGDGRIQFDELLSTIDKAKDARMAAKVGKSIELNQALEHVRGMLRTHKKLVAEAWQELDADHDSCLTNIDIVRLMRRFIKDLQANEVRCLLARLQEWDVNGDSKLAFEELYQALELCKIYRVRQGGAPCRSSSPVRASRHMVPGRPQTGTDGEGGMHSSSPSERLRSPGRMNKSMGEGMKETFLRERIMQLEAAMREAHTRQGGMEDDAKKLELLRRDLAMYKAKIEGLEQDFMKVDVLGRLEATGDNEELQKAWEIASTFKKRYMEFKGDLDNLRITYARMQAQLEETHKLLHQEHKRRYRLEDENTTLQMENMRIKDLEDLLHSERSERVKLEREYLSLQQKALSAPGTALAEVRNLREEVFSLRRAKGLAEQKEADVRREMSHIREQLDGMSVEQYRAWQRDYSELKKKLMSLQLDYQAAQNSLEIYRRTEDNGAGADNLELELKLEGHRTGGDQRPDADKTPEELRKELVELRSLWRTDAAEMTKLNTVLENEAAQTQEAKAALEESFKEMERIKRQMQDDLRSLRRELDHRDEKIRKLELQLRGAHNGINRALRSSMGRDARLTDEPDDMSEIGDDQNIFELHITEASLLEEHLGKEPSTFLTFDFFMHDTQATPVIASNAPQYDTVIQYVVDADPFIVEYMDTHVLELQLNRARGWDYDAVGMARVPLRQVLEDLEIGAALGRNRTYHYADIFGASGQRLGRIRYGFSFKKGMESLVKEYRTWARTKRPSEPDPRDPAMQAVQKAELTPADSAHVKVIIARCEHLVPASAGGAARPYVYYRFPGHRDPHDTKVLVGINPIFNDEASWLTARTAEVQKSFATREMEFVVFDDAAGDDPLRGIIGVAHVPLAGLAQGHPVEGTFRLINPLSQQSAGKIVLGLGWHNPLHQPGAAGDQRDHGRHLPVVFSSPLMDERVPADVSLGNHQPAGHPLRKGSSHTLQYVQQQQAEAPSQQNLKQKQQQPQQPRASNVGDLLRSSGFGAELQPEQCLREANVLQYGRGGSSGMYGLAADVNQQRVAGGIGSDSLGLAADVPEQRPPRGGDGNGFGVASSLQLPHVPPAAAATRVPSGRFGMPAQQSGGQSSDIRQHGLKSNNSHVATGGMAVESRHPWQEQHSRAPYAAQGGMEQYGLGTEQEGLGAEQWCMPQSSGVQQRDSRDLAGSAHGRQVHSASEEVYGLGADAPDVHRHATGSNQQQPPYPHWQGQHLQQQQHVGGQQHGSREPPPAHRDRSSNSGGYRLGSDTGGVDVHFPAAMLGPGAPSTTAIGRARPRYRDGISPDASPQYPVHKRQPVTPRPSSSAVLRHISAERADWPNASEVLILQLEQLELTNASLQDSGVKHVFLDSVLLDDSVLLNNEYMADQRDTVTVPPEAKRAGAILLDYAVAYNVLGAGAPRQLAVDLQRLLSSGEGLSLTISLMSTPEPNLDIANSRPGSFRQVGKGELDLRPLWAGTQQNFVSSCLPLLHSDDESVVVGHVTLTLIARPLFQALRCLI